MKNIAKFVGCAKWRIVQLKWQFTSNNCEMEKNGANKAKVSSVSNV